MPAKPLSLTPEQILYFRARRSSLVEGAPDAITCARDLMGAQAQVLNCALHAIALRTASNPTGAQLEALMLKDHTLLRTWGQRDTLHLYDARDWPHVIAARPQWVFTGRREGMPSMELLEVAREAFEQAQGTLVRSDLFELIPSSYVEELRSHPGAGKSPERFAATRLIWCLARAGHIAFAEQRGRELAYAHRSLWWPELEWPEQSAEAASALITRRYLAAFGPSTVQDIAHYLGARIGDARAWVKLLAADLVECACGEHKKLLALKQDVEQLQPAPGEWPARMLMTHKNKRLILPDAAQEKLVWKKAAVVSAVVLARGEIVATWTHKKRSKHVDVDVSPLGAWDDTYRPDVERDALRLAHHVGLELGELTYTKG